MTAPIEWIDASTFEVRGVRFHLDPSLERPLEYGLVAVQRGTASLGPDSDVFPSYRARGKRVGWV